MMGNFVLGNQVSTLQYYIFKLYHCYVHCFLVFVDMFEPSKGTGFIDIQDGDALSEPSDTEIVAHTKEQVQYGNQATSSESNSDSDVNDGPPPLNSDEDDGNGSDVDGIDGPPPLDSNDNAENTDGGEELPTSPNTGSSEDLSSKRAPVRSGKRGVKSSGDSESDSDSESGVKEAPPPLDSEDDEEENDLSSPSGENVESANVDTVESYTRDSPVEEADNDDDENDNDDDNHDNDDDQQPDHNNGNHDDEQHYDDNNDNDDDERHDDSNDDDDEYKEEEVEDTRAVPHSTESVNPEVENSEESEQSDSPAEAERQVPLQHQSGDSDDGIDNERDSDHEAAVDSVEEVHVTSVANEVSCSALPDKDSHTDELDDKENADVTEDTAISNEPNEKEVAARSATDYDQPHSFSNEESADNDSDQDSDESPEFVPMEDENELEWDVEDFDLPPQKSAKTNSKTKAEGVEVDKLKKSFLDTLKSEAEQTKIDETRQKSETKKKEKVDKGLNEKNTLKDGKKRADGHSKNVSNHHSKSEPSKHPKKVTKDTSPKAEQVKTEKKSVKDGVKNVPKALASAKQVDSATKPLKAKVKAPDNKSVDKTDVKQKSEKQRKDIKETSRIIEAPSVERKAVAKAGKVKSASASTLHTGTSDQQRSTNEQQRGQQTLPTKERKKPRPASDLQADARSHIKHKEEVNLPTIQTKKEVKKPRKSDSDATSDSLTRQKPQKTSSSESVSKQKKPTPAVIPTRKENEKPAESSEVRKAKSKRTASKPVAAGTDHEDAIVNHERKRHSDTHVPVKNAAEIKAAKPRSRPTSNGHVSSSHEKLSLHSGRHNHGSRDHALHKHSEHAHDRSKHVWLCRDDEIHKLIAQKASLLKEYESGSLAGRKVCK